MILFIIISPIVYFLIGSKAGIIVPVILYVINFKVTRVPALSQGLHLDMLLFWCIGCYFAVHKAEVFEKVETGKTAVICFLASVILIGVRFWLEFNEIMLPHRSFVLYISISVWRVGTCMKETNLPLTRSTHYLSFLFCQFRKLP